MARYDHSFQLTEQYVELTQTTPRRLVQPPAPPAETVPGPSAADQTSTEAEHSLRRIERRLGSIA